MMKKARFIAFEGIDGSGKSTQIKLLAEKLAAEKIPCSVTREPTDSPIGSLIRSIMAGKLSADGRAVAALFAADRIDHLTSRENGICRLIGEGVTVLTDRYYFSSYAYQSAENDTERVIALNEVCTEILRPDLNIFIDVPVKTALERISANRTDTDIYETEERLTRVRENYFEMFRRFGNEEKIRIIDGTAPVGEISAKIAKIFDEL